MQGIEISSMLIAARDSGEVGQVLDLLHSVEQLDTPELKALLMDTYFNKAQSLTYLSELADSRGDEKLGREYLKAGFRYYGRAIRIRDGKRTLRKELSDRKIERQQN